MRRKRTTKSKSNVRFDAVVLHFGYVESSAAYRPTTTAPGSHRSAQLQPIRSAGMAWASPSGPRANDVVLPCDVRPLFPLEQLTETIGCSATTAVPAA